MIVQQMKPGTSVIPHFRVILTGQSISCIIFMTQGHFQGQKVNLVQLLLLYVQWGPRNDEKCKMFRLIHIIMMLLNKFRFVAQVATVGNFFY